MLRFPRLPLLAFVLPGATAAHGQGPVIPDVQYPVLLARAANAEGFVPSGWRLDQQAEGDLDGDGRADIAFVVRMTDPANIVRHNILGEDPFNTNPRMLGVAFAIPAGGYRLAIQDRTLIPRREIPAQADMLDPEDRGLEIARGTLKLRLTRFMSAGSWSAGSTSFTFRWRAGAFRLIGFDYVNVQRNTSCMVTFSLNYLTHRARLEAAYADGEGAGEVRWRRLPIRPLRTIGDIGNGLEFDPEGMITGYPIDCAERRDE
jgi:hypothetical protein